MILGIWTLGINGLHQFVECIYHKINFFPLITEDNKNCKYHSVDNLFPFLQKVAENNICK